MIKNYKMGQVTNKVGTDVKVNQDKLSTEELKNIEVDNIVYSVPTKTELNQKQDKLINGETIKTINNNSLLSDGNMTLVKNYGTSDYVDIRGSEVKLNGRSFDELNRKVESLYGGYVDFREDTTTLTNDKIVPQDVLSYANIDYYGMNSAKGILPIEYEQLDYVLIQNPDSSNKRNRVQPGIFLKDVANIYIDMQIVELSHANNLMIFSTWDKNSVKSPFGCYYTEGSSAKKAFILSGSTGDIIVDNNELENKKRTIINIKNFKPNVDILPNDEIAFGSWTDGSYSGSIKFYEIKLSDKYGNLICHLVPCIQKNTSNVGFYDLKNFTFNENVDGIRSDFIPGEPYITPSEIKYGKVTKIKSEGINIFDYDTPKLCMRHSVAIDYAPKFQNGHIYSGGKIGVTAGQFLYVNFNSNKAYFSFISDRPTFISLCAFDTFDENNIIIGKYNVIDFNKSKNLQEISYVFNKTYKYVGIAFYDTDQYAVQIDKLFIKLGQTAAEYKPYWGTEIEIPQEIQNLPDYGKGLGNFLNEVNFETNIYKQYVTEVKLGDLKWQFSSDHVYYTPDLASTIYQIESNDTYGNILCNNYATRKNNDAENGINLAYNKNIIVSDPNFPGNQLEAFVQHLKDSNTILIYQLATQITADLPEVIFSGILRVEPNGRIILINEHNLPVATKITYEVKK